MTDETQIRINELARELEVKAKAIIDYLPEAGVTEKKTHSSSIDLSAAERVRKHFRDLAAAEEAAAAQAEKDKAAKEAAAKSGAYAASGVRRPPAAAAGCPLLWPPPPAPAAEAACSVAAAPRHLQPRRRARGCRRPVLVPVRPAAATTGRAARASQAAAPAPAAPAAGAPARPAVPRRRCVQPHAPAAARPPAPGSSRSAAASDAPRRSASRHSSGGSCPAPPCAPGAPAGQRPPMRPGGPPMRPGGPPQRPGGPPTAWTAFRSAPGRGRPSVPEDPACMPAPGLPPKAEPGKPIYERKPAPARARPTLEKRFEEGERKLHPVRARVGPGERRSARVEPVAPPPPRPPREITITEGITVRDLAEKLDVRAKEVLKELLDRGVFATHQPGAGHADGHQPRRSVQRHRHGDLV